MTLTPRRAADHDRAVTVLAFLGLDHPTDNDVIRSLVIDLYGLRGVQVYDTQQQQFNAAPPPAEHP